MEKERIISLLNVTKNLILRSIICISVFSFLGLLFSKRLLQLIIDSMDISVYYLSLPEAFFSCLELSVFVGIFLSLPLILFSFLNEIKKTIFLSNAETLLLLFFSLTLFYCGAFFSFFVVIPSGVKFLLSYGNSTVKPLISVGSFVTFLLAMITAFSFTFEIPLVFWILGRFDLLKSSFLIRLRRYAVLLIAIFSAIITPTPDIYNMTLLAIPMYILFEVGIIVLKIEEKRKIN